jgi:uncharacterized protein YjbI with pentapeptide repeats
MLLGVGYSDECEDYLDYFGDTFYNCDCNEDTWQEYYPNMGRCWLKYADLSYANLSYANLDWANLSYANLEDASLFLVNLGGANLAEANLTNAYCWGTFFVWANLEGTIFDGADLTYAYFDETGGDGYDDVSYDAGFSAGAGADYEDGYVDGAESGDLNLDGFNNIMDVVQLVNQIMNP